MCVGSCLLVLSCVCCVEEASDAGGSCWCWCNMLLVLSSGFATAVGVLTDCFDFEPAIACLATGVCERGLVMTQCPTAVNITQHNIFGIPPSSQQQPGGACFAACVQDLASRIQGGYHRITPTASLSNLYTQYKCGTTIATGAARMKRKSIHTHKPLTPVTTSQTKGYVLPSRRSSLSAPAKRFESTCACTHSLAKRCSHNNVVKQHPGSCVQAQQDTAETEQLQKARQAVQALSLSVYRLH